MGFVDMHVELHRSNDLLERIAVALERMAGPVTTYTPPRPATLADYSLASPEDIQTAQDAADEFASLSRVIPGSEAYIAAVTAYEDQIRNGYGQEMVDKLPWKQKPYAES